MIREIQGDLFESQAEAIVNAVNTVGVMGKGLAAEFRRRFSDDYFESYREACRSGQLGIGNVQVYELKTSVDPRYIINFPTKKHWRGKSRIEYIERGLDDLTEVVTRSGISSLAMPALGCGLGGLKWEVVRDLIVASFSDLSDVEVILFAPKAIKTNHRH